MEIIIGIILVGLLAWILYNHYSNKPSSTEEAPYKVEAPSVVAVGEPPATVVVVEGAGAIEVEQTEKPAKKTRAKKTSEPKEKKPAAMTAKKKTKTAKKD